MQVVLVSRYWTWPFIIFVLLSYWLVFPFEVQYLPSCAAPCPSLFLQQIMGKIPKLW